MFGLEMFIGRWYNWKGTCDVNVIYNEWNRQDEEWLIVKHKTLKWVKANNAPPSQGSL
jgi:hypothetical protein